MRRAASSSATTTSSGSGRSTSSRSSGRRSGSSSTSARASRTSASSRAARCPAPSGSPARGSATPSTSSATATTPRSRSATPPSCGRSATGRGESFARAPAPSRKRFASAGVEAGDRVAAYLPNIPETIAAFLGCASIGAVWSSCAPEFGVRSVVDRFAQIEPKVLLAVDGYRYGGKDFDRTAAVAEIEQRPADARAHARRPVPRGRRLGSPRRGARVRAAPVRPSALGALQLGHDRPAEGDRPQPGRDPPRAPQEAPPAPRRARRRPRLLVHDDRLDDVELPRRRAALRGVGRSLRRQSGVPEPRHALGSRRRRRDHVLRDERRATSRRARRKE